MAAVLVAILPDFDGGFHFVFIKQFWHGFFPHVQCRGGGRNGGRRGRGGRKRGGSCCCSSFGRVRGTIAQPSMRSTVVQHGSLHRAIGFGTAVVAAEAEKKRGKNDQQRKRMNNNNNKRTNPDK
tara:strand:+ start:241 stop:612 length:372 start_codon:yes stop_codon:yes gene_type:complete